MKKLFTVAATLLVASYAFAAGPVSNLNADRLFVQPSATFATGGPTTTNNDDSCDIVATPAASLLLPYFEVDFRSDPTTAVNTVFTITNVSREAQIAHITVWTDWSFPVIDFNIFLTGYDVQGISLYDLIARGVIPETGFDVSNFGRLSVDGGGDPFVNPNMLEDAFDTCAALPGPIGDTLRDALRSSLTTGTYLNCTGRVGGNNPNAVGYVTVDVANNCTQELPTDTNYYNNTILYDNVFIGDYQRINPTSTTGNYAGGETMVHIRAIPEGGPVNGPARGTPTNFPFTFYDRYTPSTNRELDRRQPLPGVFAARFLAQGTGGFGTRMAIWREGVVRDVGTAPNCASVGGGLSQYASNSALPITRVVRFDEQENPTLPGGCQVSPCPQEASFSAPETSARSVTNTSQFPADNAGTNDDGGWMYLNLNNSSASSALTDRGTPQMTQNWVTVQLTAEGRFGVDFDAAFLGNGCSPNPGPSSVIGPLANTTTHVNP